MMVILAENAKNHVMLKIRKSRIRRLFLWGFWKLYKMMNKIIVIILGVSSIGATAQAYISTPAPLEQLPNLSIDEISPPTIHKPQVLGGFELGTGIPASINEAILTKNWQKLDILLRQYRQTPDYDQLLYDYARGALYHSQGKYTQAIDIYQQILAKHPQYDYIRFDLGIMLYENKQYHDARHELHQAMMGLNDNAKAVAYAYLVRMDKDERVTPYYSLNYEQNDNVNQASDATQVQWAGRVWTKSPDSLPKKAHGVRYGVGISQDKNIMSNHYLTTKFDGRGVYYWDNQEYNEHNLSFGMGYKYKDAHHTLSIIPYAEQTWLDDSRYQYRVGVNVGTYKQMTPHLTMGANADVAHKDYYNDTLAHRYNGTIHRWEVDYRYILNAQALIFGGMDISYDDTIDDRYASTRQGVNIGVAVQGKSGMGGRLSARYAHRNFWENETLLYNYKRHDDEYYAQIALWHHKLAIEGIMPRLHINYHKIDSNMADLYSRDGMQIYISMHKQF